MELPPDPGLRGASLTFGPTDPSERSVHRTAAGAFVRKPTAPYSVPPPRAAMPRGITDPTAPSINAIVTSQRGSDMSSKSLTDAVTEAKRAAKELAQATASLSREVLAKAKGAAKDPSATAHRVGERVARELDAASKEIDRILRKI